MEPRGPGSAWFFSLSSFFSYAHQLYIIITSTFQSRGLQSSPVCGKGSRGTERENKLPKVNQTASSPARNRAQIS